MIYFPHRRQHFLDTMDFSIAYHASATAPYLVAPALSNADVVWTRPDGTTTATKTPAAAFFNATGNYTVRVSDWSKVTEIRFEQSASRNWLQSIDADNFLRRGSLTRFSAYNNSGWSQNISGWTLPASLEIFAVYSTSVSGDISGWTLPASLTYFHVGSTSVSGDISGWTLSASLEIFAVGSTSVSGDISGWTLPASLVTFYVYATSVTYGVSGAFQGATNSDNYRADNCAWTQAMVDAALADTDTSGATGGILHLHGTNAAPSAAGVTSKANLVGKGWAVLTN